jgi:hypothetical protein
LRVLVVVAVVAVVAAVVVVVVVAGCAMRETTRPSGARSDVNENRSNTRCGTGASVTCPLPPSFPPLPLVVVVVVMVVVAAPVAETEVGYANHVPFIITTRVG